MADGCRLAVDVILPDGDAAKRWPTVLILTPYVRRFELAPRAATSSRRPTAIKLSRHVRAARLCAGRGRCARHRRLASARAIPSAARASAPTTGRSPTGSWPSHGATARIGATGISYLGAACDFLASTGHKAVKAIAPLFAVWDTWADNYYPGGMLIKRLALVYDELMLALDHDRRDLREQFKLLRRSGAAGADAGRRRQATASLAREAVKGHLANFRMPDFITEFKFRDDALPYDPSFTAPRSAPTTISTRCRRTSRSMPSPAGSTARATPTARCRASSRCPTAKRRVMLGPWDHGARVNASPWRARQSSPSCRCWARCCASSTSISPAATPGSPTRTRSTTSPCMPRNGARPRAGRR